MAIAQAPDTPADIDLFYENDKFVFRVKTQSVYVYDRDTNGTPTCAAQCAQLWRPVIASLGAGPVGNWTLIERSDHSKQWRYRDRPVYTYAHDMPGQTSGDGLNGLWHLVTP